MTVGQRLKEQRKMERITLAVLAERTGLSISYLSDIERGRTSPSLESFKKIAIAYRLTPDELIKGVV